MEILDRLKKLHSNNPDIQEMLETAFPELEDKNPYIFVNQLFMRKGRKKSLYQLNERDGRLSIKNITDDAYWSSVVKVSNPDAHSKKDFYLTKARFAELLKKSGVKLDSIKILNEYEIGVLYNLKWEE